MFSASIARSSRIRFDAPAVINVTSAYSHAATRQLGMQPQAALPVQVGGAPAFGCRRPFAPKESTLANRKRRRRRVAMTVCLRLTARRNTLSVFNVEALGEQGLLHAALLIGWLPPSAALDRLIRDGFPRDQTKPTSQMGSQLGTRSRRRIQAARRKAVSGRMPAATLMHECLPERGNSRSMFPVDPSRRIS
jgi:hypothetical protein